MNTTSIPSATMPAGVATRGHTGMRCLSSRLCSPGLAGRPIIQVEPLTAAAVRTSQLGQNCATNVACRLLRICTREAAHIVRSYEILGQPPVAAKPGKGSLDHPAPWQHLKTLGLVRSLDDLERPLPVPEKSGLQFLAGVGAIGKDMPQPREKITDRGQDLRGAIAILDMSSMHLHANQMPAGIGDDVARGVMTRARRSRGANAPRFSVV